jgi:hypothetical protein
MGPFIHAKRPSHSRTHEDDASSTALTNQHTQALVLPPQVVRLEDMAVQDQLETVRCASLLLGVHGAGLGWMAFMRKGRDWHLAGRGLSPSLVSRTMVFVRLAG